MTGLQPLLVWGVYLRLLCTVQLIALLSILAAPRACRVAWSHAHRADVAASRPRPRIVARAAATSQLLVRGHKRCDSGAPGRRWDAMRSRRCGWAGGYTSLHAGCLGGAALPGRCVGLKYHGTRSPGGDCAGCLDAAAAAAIAAGQWQLAAHRVASPSRPTLGSSSASACSSFG